ncbi:MAG: hypothetical protein KTR21_07665 [Rhodobacteraceae bacterium]|nr:hypothetical protein [Paracoccaceae bacterium]
MLSDQESGGSVFATASEGQQDFADNIQALVGAGADIIVDDINYFFEPRYADGVIAQAYAEAVDEGVVVFSSAGNMADDGVSEAFRPSGEFGEFGEIHDWDPGASVDLDLDIVVQPRDTFSVRFQWPEPYASTSPLAMI